MATVQDPVCGMQIDDETAEHSTDYQGTRYFFCSEHCYEQFNMAPATYVGG
jgi:Cu+-exporting ATPase